MKKQRVVHLITGLGKGGAETMLYQIIKNGTINSPMHTVVSLGLSHYYEEQLQKLGVEVIILDIKRNPLRTLTSMFQIGKKAEILCCWMYLPNLLGYIVGRKHVKKLIWCIRHSDLRLADNSRKTILFSRICARLSPNVDLIAYNGYEAKKIHENAGYRPVDEVVLDNGIDETEYFHDEEEGKQVRRLLGIGDDRKVVLSVARNTGIKDLPTFIRALSLIRQSEPNVIGIMCGDGVDSSNRVLIECCKENGLSVGTDVYLIGFHDNVREIMNAADVYILHSAGEAFPNTLLQAMACEISVAATNVGDVKRILDDDRLIVETGDYRGLAKIALDLLAMSQDQKEICRKRNREIVLSRYNIRKIVERYEGIFNV